MKTVTIVGAGIAGLSGAWALTKRGFAVTIYEQANAIPNPLSASGDEHRIIRRAYGQKSGYAKRIDEAHEMWETMFEDIGAYHLISNGFLIISQKPNDEAEQYRGGLLAGGYALELLTPTAAADRFAFLQDASFRYAGYSPEGGVLMCKRIAEDLSFWLKSHGVDIRRSEPVTALDHEAGTVTVAGGMTNQHDRIIVAAGAWVLKLFPKLAGVLNTNKTAVCFLTPPDDLKTS